MKRRAWVILALLVGLCGSAGAQADERALARQLKEEGAQALARGQPAVALERLQRAYRIFPSINLVFDLGVVLEKLDRDLDALDAFERFLEEATQPPPHAQAYAIEHAARLRLRLAHIEVTSDVAGAHILLDGQPVATTPRQRAIHMAAGNHRVTLEKANVRFASHEVTVAAGETVRLAIERMKEEPATPPSSKVARPAPSAPLVPESPPKPRRWFWLVAAGSVAVVALTVGLSVGLTSSAPRFNATLGEGGPK